MSYYDDIEQTWLKVLEEFFSLTEFKPKEIIVLGCSTSEVLGKHIGKGSSAEAARILFPPLWEEIKRRNLFLAVQGCEHINRALVVERECADDYRLEEVTVKPALHAGGAMSVRAWEEFTSPVMVERIQAHGGLDLGDTFIGMHLKAVAVPVRLSVNTVGKGHLTCARTRPRLIGGGRACYPE